MENAFWWTLLVILCSLAFLMGTGLILAVVGLIGKLYHYNTILGMVASVAVLGNVVLAAPYIWKKILQTGG